MSIRSYTKSLLLLSSALSIALVVIVAINAQKSMQQMSHNNSELFKAYKISEAMKAFRSNYNVLENKRKGYIITGDAKFLEAYKEKETALKAQLKTLEDYFKSSNEEELFFQLKDLSYRNFAQGKSPAASANLSGFQANDQNIEQQVEMADEVRSTLDTIAARLDNNTLVLLENSVDYVAASRTWNIVEIALAIILSLTAVAIVFRDINTRTRLENELRVAKQRSDENAIIKEQFMANMSHEIRTPLNAIIGFSNLLSKTNLQEPQREHLQAIHNSSQNLLNIVNDVLDFSKLEAGQLSIEKISFDLHQILQQIKVMFQPKALEKNISFNVLTEQAVPQFVFGDPNRLQQVLINIVNNAVKFTEQGQVTLRCELKSIEHDVAALVFRVQDTGIGIAADKLNDVFERFKQASSDTTRKYGGTGLGLSIVKDLVERQNGSISVKSKVGQGSEFTVQISYPLSFETESTGTATSATAVSFEGKQLKVLLAEDNVLNQKLAGTYLQQVGLLVDIVSDGAEAINKISKQHYDLILMDIHMPVLDGYLATESIRKDLKNNTPIVAMTANTLEGEKEKCLQLGMNDYLSKPFKEQELIAILQKWLPEQGSMVDLQHFKSLTMGDKTFMREMIELYLQRNPDDLQQLGNAVQNNDYKLIKDLSHKMKTSVGFMGLTQLLGPLNDMETLAQQSKEDSIYGKHFAHIKSTCIAAQKVFEQQLVELNSL